MHACNDELCHSSSLLCFQVQSGPGEGRKSGGEGVEAEVEQQIDAGWAPRSPAASKAAAVAAAI